MAASNSPPSLKLYQDDQQTQQKIDFEKRLTELVRQFPLLYDHEDKWWRYRMKKDQAWKQIADQLSLESGDTAEIAFRNLRGKYSRVRKQYLRKGIYDFPEYNYLKWMDNFMQFRYRQINEETTTVDFSDLGVITMANLSDGQNNSNTTNVSTTEKEDKQNKKEDTTYNSIENNINNVTIKLEADDSENEAGSEKAIFEIPAVLLADESDADDDVIRVELLTDPLNQKENRKHRDKNVKKRPFLSEDETPPPNKQKVTTFLKQQTPPPLVPSWRSSQAITMSQAKAIVQPTPVFPQPVPISQITPVFQPPTFIPQPVSGRSEDGIYGELIIAKLKHLPKEMKLRAKNEIDNILFKYELIMCSSQQTNNIGA